MGTTAHLTAGKVLAMVMAPLALALPLGARAAALLPVNLSGYEFLLGTSCTIGGQPGTCGVQFGGWTGGGGPAPNGWTHFPGTGQGLWKANVSYTGPAAFGGTVQVMSGRFDLFTIGRTVSGTVTSGTVKWPSTDPPDIGCGTRVALVKLYVTFGLGVSGSFQGCLHDLPAGSVIPPTVWGELQ